MEEILHTHMMTQPRRVGLLQILLPWAPTPKCGTLLPFLHSLSIQCNSIASNISSSSKGVASEFSDVAAELTAGAAVVAERAISISHLYNYVCLGSIESLRGAHDSITRGLNLVQQQASHFRVPKYRIAAWRRGPTSCNIP